MLEDIPNLFPISFFDISVDIKHTKRESLDRRYLLPNTAPYMEEERFSEVYFGWSEHFLSFRFDVSKKIEEVFYPDYRKGDSIEIFLDTRNLKSYGYITKFCHHFLVLPKGGEPVVEVTKFRPDDMHNLADPTLFKSSVLPKRGSYVVELTVPSENLHGFDRSRFEKIGFTYRINRYGGESQHFSLSSLECKIEKLPAFWATANLVL